MVLSNLKQSGALKKLAHDLYLTERAEQVAERKIIFSRLGQLENRLEAALTTADKKLTAAQKTFDQAVAVYAEATRDLCDAARERSGIVTQADAERARLEAQLRDTQDPRIADVRDQLSALFEIERKTPPLYREEREEARTIAGRRVLKVRTSADSKRARVVAIRTSIQRTSDLFLIPDELLDAEITSLWESIPVEALGEAVERIEPGSAEVITTFDQRRAHVN